MEGLSSSITTINGDKHVALLAHARSGKYTVFVKACDDASRHEAKTRAWFIAKKLANDADQLTDLKRVVDLSNAFVQVKYNKCVYEDSIMSELSAPSNT